MDSTIKTIFNSWLDRKLPKTFPRETSIDEYFELEPKKIIVVTGFRRIGKTYLILHTLHRILEEMDREEIIYVNFDDERIPKRTEFLSELIPILRSSIQKEIQMLVLDEVQDMPNWGTWLRRIHDTEEMRLVVTGSSSKVSSREIPTELRGRCLEVKLFPLSFREFLVFNGIEIDTDRVPQSEIERVKVARALEEYLLFGGMPEVVLSPEYRKFEILQDYFRTVVQRDIAERYHIKNEEVLRALLRLLLNSTQYSVSKLFNTMKSMGYSIGKTTLNQYLAYIESTYFMFSLQIFSPKVKDQLQYPRKVYFVDTGFINSLSTRLSENSGRLYENTVACELMRRTARGMEMIHYWKDQTGKEVDFVVVNGFEVTQLIQVSYDLEFPDTLTRETRALIKGAKKLNCTNLMLITRNEEKVIEEKGYKIKCVPLWRWLLDYQE